MAKRQSPVDPLPQNDPFDADIEDLNLDDLNVDDMHVDDVPHTDIDLDSVMAEQGAGAPLSVGQIIGGAVQVIVSAVLIFVVMVALAGGVVLAGQRVGVIPARGGTASTTTTSTESMTAGAAPSAPTATPQPSATPRPEVAADPACPQAAAWWSSQQVQSNYVYFTQQVMDLARSSNNIAALTEQMRIHRDFVANTAVADPCIDNAKAALLKAFDATIAVARAVNAHDDVQVAQQQPAEDQAYQDLDTALQAVGVDITAPVSG